MSLKVSNKSWFHFTLASCFQSQWFDLFSFILPYCGWSASVMFLMQCNRIDNSLFVVCWQNSSGAFRGNQTKTVCASQFRIQTRRMGGSQIGGREKCLHLNTKGCLRQSLCVTQKRLSFPCQKVAIIVGRTMLFFQGITTVWKRFLSLVQKTFEMGRNQWTSFYTSYTYLVYLQNVFKRYKSVLRAIVCHCFCYP